MVGVNRYRRRIFPLSESVVKATGCTPYRAYERGQITFRVREFVLSELVKRKQFDNMGGNAEDLAFRPMHVEPFTCV